MKRALLIPFTFVRMNWAAVAGLYHFVRGGKDVWTNAHGPYAHGLRASSDPRAQWP